jgi:acyl-CoA thioester hydrolase
MNNTYKADKQTISSAYTNSIEVIFRDVDSFGHVNNAVYFTYLETIRTKYFRELKARSGIDEMDMIVAKATCNYKSPAYIAEQLDISLGITRFGKKSFDCMYIVNTDKGRKIASAKTIQVAYDYNTKTTIMIPEQFKQAVIEYQGGLSFPEM